MLVVVVVVVVAGIEATIGCVIAASRDVSKSMDFIFLIGTNSALTNEFFVAVVVCD